MYGFNTALFGIGLCLTVFAGWPILTGARPLTPVKSDPVVHALQAVDYFNSLRDIVVSLGWPFALGAIMMAIATMLALAPRKS